MGLGVMNKQMVPRNFAALTPSTMPRYVAGGAGSETGGIRWKNKFVEAC